MLTGNHRAWRHVLAARTTPGVEEEMWPIMYEIGKQLKFNFPMIYQDMFLAKDETKNNGSLRDGWAFEYDKV